MKDLCCQYNVMVLRLIVLCVTVANLSQCSILVNMYSHWISVLFSLIVKKSMLLISNFYLLNCFHPLYVQLSPPVKHLTKKSWLINVILEYELMHRPVKREINLTSSLINLKIFRFGEWIFCTSQKRKEYMWKILIDIILSTESES